MDIYKEYTEEEVLSKPRVSDTSGRFLCNHRIITNYTTPKIEPQSS